MWVNVGTGSHPQILAAVEAKPKSTLKCNPRKGLDASAKLHQKHTLNFP